MQSCSQDPPPDSFEEGGVSEKLQQTLQPAASSEIVERQHDSEHVTPSLNKEGRSTAELQQNGTLQPQQGWRTQELHRQWVAPASIKDGKTEAETGHFRLTRGRSIENLELKSGRPNLEQD